MANAYDYSSPSHAIVVVTDNSDEPVFDEDSGTLQTLLPDGVIEISFGPPQPLRRQTKDFDDNLAEDLSESELGVIAEKLLLGIEQDLTSRSEWLENMQQGISLLGLQIKNPRGAAASGSPAENVSTVDHPLLLEAVLRFQANARGELLPSDGPVKVRNDGEGGELGEALAYAIEKDMNHYLTKTAKEYYPDTDRMLLMLGFSGIAFKKGLHDPIKRRPVIASINAEDLIVSNAATDLDGAGRITHRIMMKPSMLRRMQLVGAYRDIELPDTGMPPQLDAVKTKVNELQGIAPAMHVEPGDMDRELYECYCEIEVPGFEHELDGERTGLPLPYKVVVDKDARRVLEIRRNWHEDDDFCLPRNRIIAYIFIPGLGFYGIGLLNVLGNAAKAVTAAWRLMIDAGMFANFPGFLYLKSLAKQLTNQFRVPPGGGMPIDGQGGQDIRAMVMPLPYKDPSAVFIQLIENISQTAQRVGGTAETQIGEGKQDAPVGTTLALIEQATKLMSAVHKRLHQAQGQEFDMLKSLLMEDPEALWRHNKKSKVLALLTQQAGQQAVVDAEVQAEDRHRAMFLAALSDCELVPAADPNTSSQTERYLKVTAVRQMAATNPSIDLNAVDRKAFRTLGWDDVDSYFKPAQGPQGPSPEDLTAQATMTAANARVTEAGTRQNVAQFKAQADREALASRERIADKQLARELVIHNADQRAKMQETGVANQNAAADATAERAHKLQLAHLANQSTARIEAQKSAAATSEGIANRQHEAAEGGRQMQHEAVQDHVQRQHEAELAQHDGVAAQRQGVMDLLGGVLERQHATQEAELDRKHERAMPKPKAAAKRFMGGRVEAPDESGPDVHAINSLTEAVTQLIRLQSAPRIIDRDTTGRAIGAHIDLGALDRQPPRELNPVVEIDADGVVTVEMPE